MSIFLKLWNDQRKWPIKIWSGSGDKALCRKTSLCKGTVLSRLNLECCYKVLASTGPFYTAAVPLGLNVVFINYGNNLYFTLFHQGGYVRCGSEESLDLNYSCNFLRHMRPRWPNHCTDPPAGSRLIHFPFWLITFCLSRTGPKSTGWVCSSSLVFFLLDVISKLILSCRKPNKTSQSQGGLAAAAAPQGRVCMCWNGKSCITGI